MVKEEDGSKMSRATRNTPRRSIAKVSERNAHHAARGRPKKDRSGSDPYTVQKQFTQEFIQFGKSYLEWKLNDNYVWTTDFDRKDIDTFDKLPFDNQRDEQCIEAIIVNMNNMMEAQVGRQFRLLCIQSYHCFKSGKKLQQAIEQLLPKIFEGQNYTYLTLKNQLIPSQRRVVKEDVLKNFFTLTVGLIYKVSQKQTTQQ